MVEVEISEKILVEPGGVFRKSVKPFGTGGVIYSKKEFIGKEVLVIVIDKIKKGGVKNESKRLTS